MKLFTGMRQTGNTYRMIEHSERMLRAEFFKSDIKREKEYNILIVGLNMDTAMKLRQEFIESVKFLDLKPTTPKLSKIVTLESGSQKCNIEINIPDNVTLSDLNKYDWVIIDDVFKAHPYKEKILIRCTVE